MSDLKLLIREVPDFPKPGINFYDITTLLKDAAGWREVIDALQAQNAVTPAGVVQTGEEELLVRVSGAFRSERDLLAVNFVANGRLIRLGIGLR